MAEGEEGALEQLYAATVHRIYALALRVTRHPAGAEEVTEEVFYQAWREARRFDVQRGQVLAWMQIICRSRALDWLRRRDPAELHEQPDTLASPLTVSDPLDILLQVETDSRIHRGLMQLNADDRQLVALSFYKGMSHQEIAALTAMPLGTVKTRIRRALQTLEQWLLLDSEQGYRA